MQLGEVGHLARLLRHGRMRVVLTLVVVLVVWLFRHGVLGVVGVGLVRRRRGGRVQLGVAVLDLLDRVVLVGVALLVSLGTHDLLALVVGRFLEVLHVVVVAGGELVVGVVDVVGS